MPVENGGAKRAEGWPSPRDDAMMSRMGWKPASQALRALVLALLLPLALSTGRIGLPGLARILGGPATHVCHCEVRVGHTTCACAICHPDREDYRASEESIRGTCGDDDLVAGGALGVAILVAPFVVQPRPRASRAASVDPPALASLAPPAPPTPPPRVVRA